MSLLERLRMRKLWRLERAIYGGWSGTDRHGRRIRVLARCHAPNMALYRANWNERKREGR